MNIKDFIESGTIEMYIAGVLTEQENEEVYNTILQNTEAMQELLAIEQSVVKLTAVTAPVSSKFLFPAIKEKLGLSNQQQMGKVVPLNKPETRWYTGWAAAMVLGVGLTWYAVQYNSAKNQLANNQTEQGLLEQQIFEANSNLEKKQNLLAALRKKDIVSVPLGGQTVSPESYAKVYWDKKAENIYIDVQGLPEPPEGKVYQVWSLTLDPLTPTSLGTLDGFTTDENKVFTIENANASEAFGITLEPTGGSDSPTMEQLYTLGVVKS